MSAENSTTAGTPAGALLEEDVNVAREVLLDKMKSYLDLEKYTDLEIRCAPRTWKVHRVVVCASSPVFERMCDSPFKEGEYGVIDLEGDDPLAVGHLIEGLYISKFSVDEDSPPMFGFGESSWKSESHCILINAKTYALASKYDVASVKAICVRQTKALFERLEAVIFNYSKEAMAIAQTVWTTTPNSDRPLRLVYLDLFAKLPSFQTSASFLQLVRELGDFAVDVFVMNQQKPTLALMKDPLECFRCIECYRFYGTESQANLCCKRRGGATKMRIFSHFGQE